MKWEYRIIRVTGEIEPGYLSKRFSNIGIDGWELVSVDNGIAYFRRPIQPKSEAEILAQLDKQIPIDTPLPIERVKVEDPTKFDPDYQWKLKNEVPTKQVYDD